jgi:hypothetical protein
MHADDAVVNLTATPQPLPRGTDGMLAALSRSGFVQTADGFLVGMLAGDQALALIADARLIPLDRFDETL